jgi:hypothetical protein
LTAGTAHCSGRSHPPRDHTRRHGDHHRRRIGRIGQLGRPRHQCPLQCAGRDGIRWRGQFVCGGLAFARRASEHHSGQRAIEWTGMRMHGAPCAPCSILFYRDANVSPANLCRSSRTQALVSGASNLRRAQKQRAQSCGLGSCGISGRPCGTRTCDQRIKSPLLYQLS